MDQGNKPRRGTKALVSEVDLTDSIISVGDDLKRHRILWFHLPVEEQAAQLLTQRLLALDLTKVEPIKLFICSDGGWDYDMWSIIDMMRWVRSPVFTYAMGICASAATGLFVAGDKRFIFENAYMMLHSGSSEASGEPQDIAVKAKHVAGLEERYLSLISETTGKKPETLKKLLRDKGDIWLDSAQSVKWKLAHEVIKGRRSPKLLMRRRRKKS
jgi:ATP-dependent Clp protease protease subunit